MLKIHVCLSSIFMIICLENMEKQLIGSSLPIISRVCKDNFLLILSVCIKSKHSVLQELSSYLEHHVH